MSNNDNGNVTFKHVRTITDGTMTFVFDMITWARPGVISVTVDARGRALSKRGREGRLEALGQTCGR